jgi:hypothetical protein
MNEYGLLLQKHDPVKIQLADYYSIDEMLSEIASWREPQPGMSHGKLTVHADNMSPHMARSLLRCIESSEMPRSPDPLSSPELAPSDFSLFGNVKSRLHVQHFEIEKDLLARPIELTGTIDNGTLGSIFLERMERFEKCLSINDQYVGGDE